MSMDDILESLPQSPLAALHMVLQRIDQKYRWVTVDECYVTSLSYDDLIECLAIVNAFSMKANCSFHMPELNGNEEYNAQAILVGINAHKYKIEELYSERRTEKLLSNAVEKYSSIIIDEFYYEFSDGDITKIQNLINELREELSQSKLFSDDHQRRLLARLEKLQAELHKKMSSLNGFWGMFVESGVMLGKFGEEVKPFTDRIREITGIVWRSQARAEELPSDSPLPLDSCESNKDE